MGKRQLDALASGQDLKDVDLNVSVYGKSSHGQKPGYFFRVSSFATYFLQFLIAPAHHKEKNIEGLY